MSTHVRSSIYTNGLSHKNDTIRKGFSIIYMNIVQIVNIQYFKGSERGISKL